MRTASERRQREDIRVRLVLARVSRRCQRSGGFVPVIHRLKLGCLVAEGDEEGALHDRCLTLLLCWQTRVEQFPTLSILFEHVIDHANLLFRSDLSRYRKLQSTFLRASRVYGQKESLHGSLSLFFYFIYIFCFFFVEQKKFNLKAKLRFLKKCPPLKKCIAVFVTDVMCDISLSLNEM